MLVQITFDELTQSIEGLLGHEIPKEGLDIHLTGQGPQDGKAPKKTTETPRPRDGRRLRGGFDPWGIYDFLPKIWPHHKPLFPPRTDLRYNRRRCADARPRGVQISPIGHHDIRSGPKRDAVDEESVYAALDF